MPTVKQIRDAIKAKIITVANIGVVHTYERYAKDASKFAEFYKFGNPARILGWHVRRVSTREHLIDTERWSVLHGWRIRGFKSLDDADATEESFDDQIEQIRDAFRLDDDLGGLVFSLMNPQNSEIGIQVIEHVPVMLAGVLCHKAELGLTTQHLN